MLGHLRSQHTAKLQIFTSWSLSVSTKELKEKHDKLERIHNELITSHNMLKEQYTTLNINYDNLVIAQEFLSNEPQDATNNVVKIDIATSCDDLIVESIEQGSSGKGKQVVETDNYDEYVKLKIMKSSRKILNS